MRYLVILSLVICSAKLSFAQERLPTVQTEGGLKLAADERGNRLPDYAYCGYRASEQALPNVTARLRLMPSGQDDTQRIQAALSALADLPVDDQGWHGALELSAGEFHVSGTIEIDRDHIVLRGTRDERGENLTTIIATGLSRRPLIALGQRPNVSEPRFDDQRMRPKMVLPVGSKEIQWEANDQPVRFSKGQSIVLEIESSKQWIASLGMDRFPSDDNRGSWLDWKPGTLNQKITRTVVQANAQSLVLDAPIMTALDDKLSPITIRAIAIDSAIASIGVEHLKLVSQADRATNPKDEQHAWDGVRVLRAIDAWVRGVDCRNFVGSAVRVSDQARRVTVVDCQSIEPVSEDAGWRRRTFVTAGQQTLFLRCRSEEGRHDFCVESLAAGPNAFVRCSAVRAARFSGPVGSWCTGVLYDNVEIDGSSLELTNLETQAAGTGWTSAYCTLWNCVAPKLIVRRPAGAYNWAVGVWGEVAGDGLWVHLNEFVTPDSLYEYQLAERIGRAKAREILDATSAVPSTSNVPLFDHSKAIDAQPSPGVKRVLRIEQGQLTIGPAANSTSANQKVGRSSNPNSRAGEVTSDRELLTGKRAQLSWWRGSVIPSKVAEFGPNLTRFVPGHDERFFTDDLADAIDLFQKNGIVAVDHHWGLWYDRRRDDHQMVRRIDGEAWPPFYEHPWARSGVGTAYDGLSKYDLMRFNPWYFQRLAEFARLGDERGMLLIEHMYFQHNILEAGAHWAEFPWRPDNCLQATGFPEPPVYQNRKRVFMADDFYDCSHPVRRDLHTRYIRHCLDTLSPYQNVMFVLGEEFTGPAHFMRFWLETIGQWQKDTGRDVVVVLSATRDVQEETLKDPELLKLIDAIEIKYWWHTKDGGLYDPPGGHNLAPRQQFREWSGSKSRSAESIAQSVKDVKNRFPSMAVFTAFPETAPFNP